MAQFRLTPLSKALMTNTHPPISAEVKQVELSIVPKIGTFDSALTTASLFFQDIPIYATLSDRL